jgi:isocitrate/isopropylmalate dehydrogenase
MERLVVRELVGGAYFGKKELKETSAFDVIEYDAEQIERILRFAFRAALARKKHLTLVHKANVLLTSVLWKKHLGQGPRRVSQGHVRRLLRRRLHDVPDLEARQLRRGRSPRT